MAKKKQAKKQKPKQKVKKNKKSGSTINKSLNKMLGSVGETIGNLALPGIGGLAGKALAQGGHKLFKTITGYGDYQVKSNSLMNGGVPIFANKNPGNNRFVNREFIMDVKSSQNFLKRLDQEPINPGNPNLFPWLSNIAQNFQEHIWHGLIFQFKSTSGSAISSTNNALGTIILGSQYNPYDQPFSNKQNMENTMYSSPSAPDKDTIHPIECARAQTVLTHLCNRNSTNNGSNQDSRFYDLAVLTLAAVGMQASDINLGELHVSYDIEFLKPITPPSGSSDPEVHYKGTTGITALTPFSTNPTISSSSSPFSFITFNTVGDTITFDDQYYGSVLINIHVAFSNPTVVSTANLALVLNNAVGIKLWDSNTSYYIINNSNTTTSANIMMALNISAPGASIKMTSSDTWATATAVDTIIVPISLTN